MLTIRFARRGRNKRAFFDLVVAEKTSASQKKFIEKFGYFDPHADGGKGKFVFDKDRILHFLKNGSQVSESAARILFKNGIKEAEKFVPKRVTKPRKETPKKYEAPASVE